MSEKSTKPADERNALGFALSTDGNVRRWVYTPSSTDSDASPVRLSRCVLVERGKRLQIEDVSLTIPIERLRQALVNQLKSEFSTAELVEVHAGADGALWVLVEFNDAEVARRDPLRASNAVTSGLAGFEVNIFCSGSHLQLSTYGHFAIGSVPKQFLLASLNIFARALGLQSALTARTKDGEALSLLACDLEVVGFVHSAIAAGQKRESVASEFLQNVSTFDGSLQRTGSGAVGWEFAAQATGKGVWMFSLSEEQVPVEVLESRELRSQYADIEINMIKGKVGEAFTKLQAELARDSQAQYLQRRLALLALSRAELSPSLMQLLEQSPLQDLTVLTARLQMLIGNDTVVQRHKLLVAIGRELAKQLHNAEDARALELVLPEMLGDVLAQSHVEKAMACYERILSCRGEVPRVLRKMTHLAAQLDMTDLETNLLERATAVEREPTLLADLHFRLAQIRSAVDADVDVAIKHGLHALQADQTHVGAALLTTDLLVRKEKYHDALRILGQLFEGLRDRLTPGLRATLAWRTGRIWQENLGRMDLAKARFEQALAIDEGHLGSLQALEQIYRAADNRQDLATVLHRLYDHYLDQGDEQRLQQLKQELVHLYKDELKDPQRALQLVMGESQSERETTQDIDKIMSWQETGMDWTLLYDLLTEKLREVKEPAALARFRIQIADLCRTKLERHDAAVEHYLAVGSSQMLAEDAFEYLRERLGQARRYDDLARCLIERLENTADEKRTELLRELLLLPKGISANQRDDFAIQIYTLSEDEKVHLQKRFQEYLDHSETQAFLRLRDILTGMTLNRAEREYWLAYFIESLPRLSAPEVLVAMDADLQALYELRENDPQVLQLGIKYFTGNNASRFLNFYIVTLMESGILPDLPRVQLEATLREQPKDLAKLHELLAAGEPDEAIAVQHLREAAQLYRTQSDSRSKVDNLMAEYLVRGPATIDAIEDFESVVEQTGSWQAFAKVLRRQIEFYEQDRNMQIKLLQRYGEVNRSCLKDYAEAISAYSRLLPLLPDGRDIKFLLLNIAIEANDVNEELQHLHDCLNDEYCLQDIVRSEFVINRLCGKHDQAAQVKAALVPKIQAFVDREMPELAGGLAEVLLRNNISTLEVLRIAFLAAAVRRDLVAAEKHWLTGLPWNKNLAPMRSYLEDAIHVLQSIGAGDFAVTLMRQAVQLATSGGIHADLCIDVLLIAGQFLRDKDRDRRVAMVAFQQVKLLDKDDDRSWIPLYYLLKEFGDEQALLAHLNFILPQLERNQTPLKAYPITVESLEAERERIKDISRVDVASLEPLTQMSEVIKLAVAAVEEESPSEFSHMEYSLRRVAGEPEPAGHAPVIYGESFAVSSEFQAPAASSSSRASEQSGLRIVGNAFVDAVDSKSSVTEPSIQDVNAHDWRATIMALNVSRKHAVKTLDQAFATKVEKHVAIQAMAVLAGDIQVLNDWQWNVWRDIRKAEYPLSGKDRFPVNGVPTSINSDLHRLLVATIPMLVKLFSGRYGLRHLQKKLGLSSQQLMKARVPLVWDRGLLAKAGFTLYKDRIRKHRFSAYNVTGLGAELFFDGSKRELYLDESYYVRQPTSHLFHRVLGLLWTIKLQYFVPLSLNPTKQILPSLQAIREHLDTKGLDKLKKVLVGDAQDIGKLLGLVDKSVLRALFAKVPVIQEAELVRLVQDMQAHTYRLLLAETLDVVGLFESICDLDLLDQKLDAKAIVTKSPHVAGLLEFITQMKL